MKGPQQPEQELHPRHRHSCQPLQSLFPVRECQYFRYDAAAVVWKTARMEKARFIPFISE
ncbi:MAG: hypothetical protein CVU71_04485 [Deltaproteobacteria bacterium HGW-Deltaproteobacteria-6]|nr:MAG: hypothetical protein CVU71_04485 [Deltaproteobacteria bacterium HGW-Deltaproteobacteria-6]